MMLSYYFINLIKKKLIKGIKNKGGRNFLGRVCIQGRGGGNKRKYRFIDFFRRLNCYGFVMKIFRDSNRTAKVCLILYVNGLNALSLLQKDVKLNSLIYSGSNFPGTILSINNGYSLLLKYMPLFSPLSNIELQPFSGSILARAASVNAIMISKTASNAILKFNSNWLIKVSVNCIASLGRISSIYKNDIIIGNAGKNRALGYRPKVRGVAKNPCDHPHGGGNGKKAKPMVPVNAWHTVFKWRPTTITKNAILKRRRYKKLN